MKVEFWWKLWKVKSCEHVLELETSCTHLDKKLQYCSSDSCCINKRSYEPLGNQAISCTDYSTALRTYVLQAHGVLRWGHTFLQAKEHHVHEINLQWLRYTHATYSDAQQWQSWQLKHAHALARANKMAGSCASSFNANSVALQRGCFTRKTRYNSIICSTEAIRRSFGQFVTV